MKEPICQKPGCGSRRVAKFGDFWWCREHGFHSVGCRCDKCVTYLEPDPADQPAATEPANPHSGSSVAAFFGCSCDSPAVGLHDVACPLAETAKTEAALPPCPYGGVITLDASGRQFCDHCDGPVHCGVGPWDPCDRGVSHAAETALENLCPRCKGECVDPCASRLACAQCGGRGILTHADEDETAPTHCPHGSVHAVLGPCTGNGYTCRKCGDR